MGKHHTFACAHFSKLPTVTVKADWNRMCFLCGPSIASWGRFCSMAVLGTSW